jgi:polysaccharide biosynthesis/export protein
LNWSEFIELTGGEIVRHLLFVCSSFFILSFCLIAGEVKEEVNKKDEVNKEDYVIGTEDILSINVWKEPELSVRELVVRPDGKISLPLVNDIQASGTTPNQLQARIAEKLKEFVASPNVNITVIRVNSHTVSVVGMVSKPGIYVLGSPLTVLDMLARVGGVTEYAKTKNIKISRNENGKIRQFSFNYRDAIRGINLQQNIVLKSGDTVLVP